MKKLACCFIVLFLLFYLFPHPTYAKNDFKTSYDVTYTINDEGMTRAVFNISLTNTTSDYYISAYSLQIGFNDIENVTASDGLGEIIPIVKKNDKGYLVSVHFNKKVIGVDKTLQFVLSLDSPEVAQKIGQSWEINIPGIAQQQDFGSFTVHVKPPDSFGKPIVVKPPQINDQLNFTKEQLGTAGIAIIFGKQQVYQFDLQYHLENNNLFPLKTEIALPPETNYQDIAISKINPPPTNVSVDKDGNWLATFQLFPSKKMDIHVTGRASVHISPNESYEKKNNLTADLDEQPYWQTKNSQIAQLAMQLRTPEKIYNYVRTHLLYDYSKASVDQKRLGSAYILQHPDRAVCLEFTDLFVAISRAAGIPAREIEGYAYSQNSKEKPLSLLHDVLHAWPEYYDINKHTWVMVDPTWGNTTGGVDYFHVLDFDHIAFAINGYSSSSPIPAGGYKLSAQENQKDVYVTFTDNAKFPDPKLAITENLPQEAIAGLPIITRITIHNAGQTAIPKQKIQIVAKGLSPKTQTIMLPLIPPYGHADIPIAFVRTNVLTRANVFITIQIGSSSFTKTIKIIPFYMNKDVLIGGGIFVILCIILYIIAERSRRLRISRQK